MPPFYLCVGKAGVLVSAGWPRSSAPWLKVQSCDQQPAAAGSAASSHTVLLYCTSTGCSPSSALVKVSAVIKHLRGTKLHTVVVSEVTCVSEEEPERVFQHVHVLLYVSFGSAVGHIRGRVPQKWVSRCCEGALACSLWRPRPGPRGSGPLGPEVDWIVPRLR